MSPLEWQDRQPLEGEDDRERSVGNTMHALRRRWNRIVEVLPNLDTALFEGRALWQDMLQEQMDVVRGRIGAWQKAVQMYAALIVLPPPVNQGVGRTIRDVERVLYAGEWPDPDDLSKMLPDQLGPELATAVGRIEKLLAPYVHARHWLDDDHHA